MANNNLTSTVYADHLRGCADLAKEIAVRMDIRDDAARQAMLATLIISADRHNLFLAPTPPHTKTSAGPNGDTAAREAAARDEALAQKADDQIKDVSRNPTPEGDAAARRTAYLTAIDQARTLLNKEGHVPPITPAGLNAYIKKKFPAKGDLGSLDVDELEKLTELLSHKLDELRANKKSGKDEIDW